MPVTVRLQDGLLACHVTIFKRPTGDCEILSLTYEICKSLYQYILNLIRSCWFAIVHVLLMVQIARSLLICV